MLTRNSRGHSSSLNCITNPNQDLVYIYVHTKLGETLSFSSQDIERKRNS